MWSPLLIDGDRTREAQALFARDPVWRSEAFLLVEFCNALVTYQHQGALRRAQAEHLLSEAERRMRGWISLPHIQALRLAEKYSVSACDARFLGAALGLGTKLVIEDARLRAVVPSLTLSLADAISS